MEIKPVIGSDYIELTCDTNDFGVDNKLTFATTTSNTITFIPKFVGLPNSKLIIGDEEFSLDQLNDEYERIGQPIILNCQEDVSLKIEIENKEKLGYFWLMFTNITY